MIEFRKVSKTFSGRAGSVAALASVDLEVAEGEFVAIVGPSGCGKSTLLKLVAGLIGADSGEISIADRSPASARDDKQLAFAPQSPALLPWATVRDNAQLLTKVNRRSGAGRVATEDEIDDLLLRVGLADFADALPHELSGGMQQRVGLVRAFALHAPVLLMDEPFAALDEFVRTEMRYLLLDLWERNRASVLFVTHSLSEAVSLADRIVVMAAQPGRIEHIHQVSLPRPRRPEQEDEVAFLTEIRAVRRLLAAQVKRSTHDSAPQAASVAAAEPTGVAAAEPTGVAAVVAAP